MIQRYSDHAANERTFLAWVRTAIAIMAFGFLVQKFDLFLKIAARSLHMDGAPARGQIFGTTAGLLLIVLGGAVMVVAVFRFRATASAIEAEELHRGPGARADIALVAMLLVLGTILFVYLIYSVTIRF
jgi:putative membrane protein